MAVTKTHHRHSNHLIMKGYADGDKEKNIRNLHITMHPSQQEIHSEIGHQYRQGSQQQIGMKSTGTTEPRQAIAMESHRIEHERDERPNLLRVPSPIASPRDIRPHGSQKDAGAQKEQGGIEQDTTEQLQSSSLDGQTQPQQGIQPDESQERIGNHNERNMYA